MKIIKKKRIAQWLSSVIINFDDLPQIAKKKKQITLIMKN